MKSLSETECSFSPTAIGPDNCTVCLTQLAIGLGKCHTCRCSPLIGWTNYARPSFNTTEYNDPIEDTDCSQTDCLRGGRSDSLVRTNGQSKIMLSDQAIMTPRDVLDHNETASWDEWLIFKDKVYSMKQLREVLFSIIALSVDRLEVDTQLSKGRLEVDTQLSNGRLPEKNTHEIKDTDDVNESHCNIFDIYCDELTRLDKWDYKRVRGILGKIISNRKTKFVDRLSRCFIGYVTQPSDTRYWDDVRQDVRLLLNDLIRADAEDKISPYMSEYMHLLQRWMNNYRHQNPKQLHWTGQDVNNCPFPLLDEINGVRPRLRSWLDVWVPFDTEIPDCGAWPVYDVSDVDLGDPHEIFVLSLKSHVDLTCLDMDIQGEVAWEVIQEGLFADDVLTPEQEMTEQLRSQRTDLCDPRRMVARREEILNYFVWKYKYEYNKVQHFLDWAETMAEGERRFLKIC